MDLRRTVAAPFRERGADDLGESEFVASLAMDRRWYSPAQATRLVDVAVGEGLLRRDGDRIVPTFDHADVAIPEDFAPDETLLRDRSAFERALEVLVDAGHDKRDAVAGINRLQAELGVAVGAAAVVYARRQGLAVERAAERALAELSAEE